jgi:hypothetical protein
MRVPYWFTYVTEENASAFRPAIDKTLRFSYSPLAELRAARRPRHLARLVMDGGHFLKYRLLRCRPLLKDPLALFSAGWLASEYDMDVVLLVRHLPHSRPACDVRGTRTRSRISSSNHA